MQVTLFHGKPKRGSDFNAQILLKKCLIQRELACGPQHVCYTGGMHRRSQSPLVCLPEPHRTR